MRKVIYTEKTWDKESHSYISTEHECLFLDFGFDYVYEHGVCSTALIEMPDRSVCNVSLDSIRFVKGDK